jgi:predicted kinase
MMDGVIFMGIQGSGKSSFYQERFFSTHVRISLDLLKTRFREQTFLNACLQTEQRFVIDNTNPTRDERQRYIAAAKANRYEVIGFYFQSKLEDCLRRNSERAESGRVPDVAILSTAKKLERFVVEEWQDEIR